MKYKVRVTFANGDKLLETFSTATAARAYAEAVNGAAGTITGAPKAEYLGNEKLYNEMCRRRREAGVPA